MTTSTDQSTPMSGFAISLSFWLTLLAAAGLFAAVSLSPKLVGYLELRDEHQMHQMELLDLEQKHAELERVIAALRDDPQFAAELARLEFDAVRPGEEILPVDSSLTLTPNAVPRQPVSQPMVRSAWRPWIGILASSQPLRNALLLSAVVLVLFAFGWLQSPGERPV